LFWAFGYFEVDTHAKINYRHVELLPYTMKITANILYKKAPAWGYASGKIETLFCFFCNQKETPHPP
jgi:hypothetical protein